MAMAKTRLERNRKRDQEGIFEVNMTPLIDVSLVLVVILMVAIPMAFQSSIALRSASAAGREGQTARVERVELSILSEDSLLVNRVLVSRASLSQTLRPILAASATHQVVVRCAGAVSHGAFVGVLDDAKACGAAQIAVVGD
jgi:biopolymer transport protein ExbD